MTIDRGFDILTAAGELNQDALDRHRTPQDGPRAHDRIGSGERDVVLASGGIEALRPFLRR